MGQPTRGVGKYEPVTWEIRETEATDDGKLWSIRKANGRIFYNQVQLSWIQAVLGVSILADERDEIVVSEITEGVRSRYGFSVPEFKRTVKEELSFIGPDWGIRLSTWIEVLGVLGVVL